MLIILPLGLFRYAIVHSGSPLAFWGVSDCIPTMKNKTVAEDCQKGSSHLVESLKSEDPMSEPVNTHFLTSTGEVITLFYFFNLLLANMA